jgi:hypothetical protein
VRDADEFDVNGPTVTPAGPHRHQLAAFNPVFLELGSTSASVSGVP